MTRVRLRSLTLTVAGLIAAIVLLLPGSHAAAQGGCRTTLPITWSLSSQYAEAYVKSLSVRVTTSGPPVTGLSVSLLTFKGDVLGSGTLTTPLTSTATINLALRYPMQPGKYTLYFQGFPNADPSCGEKHNANLLNLIGCQGGGLPVKILKPTEGNAFDYGGYYSFYVESSNGAILHNLSASLSTARGRVTGKTKIPVLFGRLYVSIPLRNALQPLPVQYTLDVNGFGPGRPRSCGAAHVDRALKFN